MKKRSKARNKPAKAHPRKASKPKTRSAPSLRPITALVLLVRPRSSGSRAITEKNAASSDLS